MVQFWNPTSLKRRICAPATVVFGSGEQ